jgi:hypothetical protein
MASNKEKSSKAKKKAQRRKKNPKPVKAPGSNPAKSIALKAHTHHACTITNPFCPAAKGSRYPDGLSSNSMPFQVKGMMSVATSAGGDSFGVIGAGGGRYGAVFGTLAAGTWTLAATWSTLAGSAFVATNAQEVRIVSWGVIWRSTAAMTACQGMVHCFSTTGLGPTQTYPQLSQNTLEDQLIPLTSGMELSWISKPLGAKAHAFRPLTDFTTTSSDFDWTTFAIEIVGGAPSITVGFLEVVVNVEVQFNNTGIQSMGAIVPPSKPSNPIATKIQAQAHSTMGSFIEGGVSKVEQAVTKKASSIASTMFSAMEDFGLGLLTF